MSNEPDLKPYYDAIIVGARCAGAATAMLLAKAGLRVLAVDRQAYGSDTLSTHALMRPAVMQLARWNLLASLIEAGAPVIETTTFHYGEQQVPVAIRPEPGLPGLIAPRRTELDRVLVDAARGAGATILHDTLVSDLSFDARGRVRGVVLADAAGHRRTIGAGHVVGADGLGSRVARLVDAPVLAQGLAQVAHVFGYAPMPARLSGYHWYFAKHVSGGLIPTNDGLACIVVSIPACRFDATFRADLIGSRRQALELLAPGLGDYATTYEVGRLKAFKGAPGQLRQAYGPGWLLVGDAGFFRDPLTSHGISDALRDAEGAATAIISGHAGALRQFQDERDSLALPLLAATDAIAAFDWSLEELPLRHKRFSEAMKAEVEVLKGRSGRDLFDQLGGRRLVSRHVEEFCHAS
ncbi:NAD(P)/FAD-dependent oxidoreductase [Nordella sp. HKS 07]|uniref:NAD(P)/FAD-dependent oxidoreductase n=1 Tax=Nordella sp. HKS 07 TaxID=2712222 RepID=UPI0013E190EB|nr:NAD(P)/FAD-dependent oxidoreductase [Nordella sp. HKS 07]QIG47163.1 NAD(P)/FAD-dependent oxidoreductase [Nordella sp. HKS 07]